MNDHTMSPTPIFDIIAVADLCFDMIISGPVQPQFNQVELFVDDYMIDLGGSVGIFATQFAKLGGSIALLGSIGKDIPGQVIMSRLGEAGVHTSLIAQHKDAKTAMGLNLYCNADRAMLTYLGVMDKNTGAVLAEELLTQTRHWHIGGYFLLRKLISAWPQWLVQLKKAHISISLDTNWDPSGDWKKVLEILPMVDVFLPNEAEAKVISGKDDITAAGAFLAQHCPLVVVKMGEKGAIVFKKDQHISYTIPENLIKDLHIADTTGAGDNFDAGFLFSWLNGENKTRCIENGFRCAISSLGKLGGVQGQLIQPNTP